MNELTYICVSGIFGEARIVYPKCLNITTPDTTNLFHTQLTK